MYIYFFSSKIYFTTKVQKMFFTPQGNRLRASRDLINNLPTLFSYTVR